MKHFTITLITVLSIAPAGCAIDGIDLATVTEPIIGGTHEPDAGFPWVVDTAGPAGSCHGVLIDSHWVLTAAHCVVNSPGGIHVSFTRTSPTTGLTTHDQQTGSAIVHPQFDPNHPDLGHDLGLIFLPTIWTDPLVRPAFLPEIPAALGQSVTLAESSGLSGEDAVMHAAIVANTNQGCGGADQVCIQSAAASACPGDSGSGLVTLLHGQNVVAAIAADVIDASCTTVGEGFSATDVYRYLTWIHETAHLVPSFEMWASDSNAHALAGDFNGDHRSDIALIGGSSWTTVPVAFTQADGMYVVTNQSINSFATWAGGAGVQVVAGDINGDGRDDLIATGGDGWYTIPVAISNGDGTFTVSNLANSTIPGLARAAGVKVLAGDVNGDGRADLILTGGTGWGYIAVGFSNGDGTFRVTRANTASFPTWAQDSNAKAAVGDVNGDGRADIVLTGGSSWTTVPMALSRGDGSFSVVNQPDAFIPTWSRGSGTKFMMGDLDGDRRADLALTGGVWSTIPVGFSRGDGTLRVTNSTVADFPGWAQDSNAKAVSGDFNGDGRADLALVGGNQWWTVPLAFSNGDGTFAVRNAPID